MTQVFLILMLIFTPIARGAVRIWAFAPVEILVLCILLLCTFRAASSSQINIRRTPLDIPILLFLAVFLITTFNSRYLYTSVMELVRLSSLAIIFYIVVNFINEEKRIKRLINVILGVGTGIALFGILQYLGFFDKSWWDSAGFLSATYVNHNHFAGYMELVIPLSIGMILSEKDLGKKSLYIYSFLILCAAFLLSMSRGGWFSLSVSMFFMAVMVFRKGRARLGIFALLTLLMIVGILLFKSIDMEVLLKRLSSYKELDFSGRLDIWKGTLGIIRNNWLLGTGPGTFIYNFPRYRPAGLNMFVNYAHSDYLQVASEMGILALGLTVFIIARIFIKGVRTHVIARTSFKTWISLSLATGVLSMSIHNLADFNFYIPANAILFTVFAGLIFNISSRREKPQAVFILKPNPFLRRFSKPLAITTIVTLIVFIASSLAAEICSSVSTRAALKSDPEKAERLAVAATRLNPLNHYYPYRLAEFYSKRSDSVTNLKESERQYKRALRLNPMHTWSWIGLADTYNMLFKYSPADYKLIDLADFAYRKALALDPTNSYYLKRFGGFLLNSGDPSLSSAMYKKASSVMSKSKTLSSMQVGFTDGRSYKETADLAFSGQDIDKALVFYRMAEEFISEKEPALLGQVRCYLKMSLVRDALRKYRDITASKKNRSALFASLGGYYLRKGYMDTAERFSEKSIAVDPANPEGYQLRYKILRKIDRDNYPVKEISKILDFNQIPMTADLKPDSFSIGFDIEESLYKEGKLGRDMFLPAGIYEFYVKAKGKAAAGVWPHMIIRFNDRDAMDTYVNDADWKDYSGIIVVDYPVNRFEVVYDNDYYDPEGMEDRNLYINKVRLAPLK